MKKLIQYIIFAAIISLSRGAIAIDQTNFSEKERNTASEYQKIIEDYKSQLALVSPEIRKEIREFRTNIAILQKQKRDLYKQLSVQAQEYLKIEEKFRKRLPVEAEDNVDLNQRENIEVDQSNR